MAKLYEIKLPAADSLKLVAENVTPRQAGLTVFEKADVMSGEPNEASELGSLFVLLSEGRLYYYVSAPDGFGWEKFDGESGPPFAA